MLCLVWFKLVHLNHSYDVLDEMWKMSDFNESGVTFV